MKKRKVFTIVTLTILISILLFIAISLILAYGFSVWAFEKSDYAIQRDKEIQERIINDPELYSILMISIKFLHLVRYRSNTFSLEYYKFILQHMPMRIIHDFLIQLVLLGTVLFLVYIYLSHKWEQ